MPAFTLQLEAKETYDLLEGLILTDSDTTTLHERYVIVVQGWIFRNWQNVKPPTGHLALSVRRRGGTTTLVDLGTLRLSLVGRNPSEISKEHGSLAEAKPTFGIVGSNLVYAAPHQFSATIHAKNVKNLAIPLTRIARKTGSPRNFPGLTWHPGKRSDDHVSFLVENKSLQLRRKKQWQQWEKGIEGKRRSKTKREKRKDVLIFHYMLKPSVFIPKREYLPDEQMVRVMMVDVTLDFYQEIISGFGQKKKKKAA